VLIMFNWLINMFDMILHTFALKPLVKLSNPGQTPKAPKG
jgi:hypothetical protein